MQYTKEELKLILDNHVLWLQNHTKGKRADLVEANLIEANLIEANLIEANLIEANLVEANLRGANIIIKYNKWITQ